MTDCDSKSVLPRDERADRQMPGVVPNIDQERLINQVADNLRVEVARIVVRLHSGGDMRRCDPWRGRTFRRCIPEATRRHVYRRGETDHHPCDFSHDRHRFRRFQRRRELGRIAIKVLGYFLFFSTLALVLGLIVALVIKPGAGINASLAAVNSDAVSEYAQKAHESSIAGFIGDIIPTTLLSALTTATFCRPCSSRSLLEWRSRVQVLGWTGSASF